MSHHAGVHAVHAGRRITWMEGDDPMTRQTCTGLITALLVAGTTSTIAGPQDIPADPISNDAVDREPTVIVDAPDPTRSESEFGRQLRDAHAEWTARVRAEQARIDRYQLRNFFGDRVQLEHVAYVVNEIEFIDGIDVGMEDFSRWSGEGHEFCIVDITVNNASQMSNIAGLAQCVLVDAAGNRYPVDEDATFALKLDYKKTLKRPVTFRWRLDRIQPGIPGRAQLVFRIPDAAARTKLGLDIIRQDDSVLVRLEERPADDPPRVERPETATWWIGDPQARRPKPAVIRRGPEEWLPLTKSAHLVTGFVFQDDLGDGRDPAPDEGIYLRVDSLFENRTGTPVKRAGTSTYTITAEDGRIFRTVRIETPDSIPAWATVTRQSFFLLPHSAAEGRLDLLIYQPVWNFTEQASDTYGWINLKR